MKLVVFGLSLSSSWGNGHATTYRALLRAFAARGHDVVFFEWDAPWYSGPARDHPDPDYCTLDLYPSWPEVRARALAEAAEADATIVGSYVHEGPMLIDALLDAGIEPLWFYDIDTPITVAKLRSGDHEYLRPDQVPELTGYLSFSGGPFLREIIEEELGARRARPLYCSVDAERYRPMAESPRYEATLSYMGTFAPDRQPSLRTLLIEPATRLPDRRFLVAGPQYPPGEVWPANVRRVEHVPPRDHAAFYASGRWQLNLTRADMREAGWSPPVRLFEAAACGAPLLSDRWPGLEDFFTPGREILLPAGAEEAVAALTGTHEDDRRALGAAARERVLAEHTSERRARELEGALTEGAEGSERVQRTPVAAGPVQEGDGCTWE